MEWSFRVESRCAFRLVLHFAHGAGGSRGRITDNQSDFRLRIDGEPPQTMNTCRTLIFAALTLASGITLAQLTPVEAPPAARQMTNSPVEQYRVLDTSLIPVKNVKDA